MVPWRAVGEADAIRLEAGCRRTTAIAPCRPAHQAMAVRARIEPGRHGDALHARRAGLTRPPLTGRGLRALPGSMTRSRATRVSRVALNKAEDRSHNPVLAAALVPRQIRAWLRRWPSGDMMTWCKASAQDAWAESVSKQALFEAMSSL